MADAEANLPKPVRRSDHVAWVGVFLILGIIAVLGILFVMTEPAMYRGRYIIATRVTNAGGMRRGDPVQMRGVPIGRVLSLEIAPQGVTMRLEIEGKYRIPKDSHVELKSGSIMQGVVADVVPGTMSEY